MKHFLIMLLVLCVGFACGEKETETSARKGRGEPRQMIPDEPMTETVSEKQKSMEGLVALKPYFDAEGTVTEKAVSSGESFNVYIIAEYPEQEAMIGAQYKLSLPEGVLILGVVEGDSVIMRSGNPEKDTSIAFHCTSGPKLMLVRYTCMPGEGFTEGLISIEAGESSKFIGTSTCLPDAEKIPGIGGTAVLKKK